VLPIVIDSTAPIVIVVSPPHMDMAWIDRQKEEFTRIWAREQRFAVITWSGLVKTMPGARERKSLADWANAPAHRELQRRLCVASSTQLDSAAKRAFLQALLWMWDPPSPHVVHATIEESLAWCLARLVEAGVDVPQRTRAHVLHVVRSLHATAASEVAPPLARSARR